MSALRTAEVIAPTIDRLRLGIASAMPQVAGPLLTSHGLAPPTLQVLAMLRNTMPARSVSRDDLAAVFVYEPDRLALVDVAVGDGLLEDQGDGRVRLGARAQALLTDLYVMTDEYAQTVWSAHRAVLDDILGITERLAAAAVADSGPALRVLGPAHEPTGASPAMLVAERLTVLRFHRFDAHVAAWTQRGLSAAEMRAAAPKDLARSIEEATNRRAAIPYEATTPAERARVVAGLASLPT